MGEVLCYVTSESLFVLPPAPPPDDGVGEGGPPPPPPGGRQGPDNDDAALDVDVDDPGKAATPFPPTEDAKTACSAGDACLWTAVVAATA